MKFANVLGIIMSRIILTVLWVVGFGAYAVVLRIVGLLRPKNTTDTYWVDPPEAVENGMQYQF